MLIGEGEILRRLCGRVVIPQTVLPEIAQRPAWLEVKHATATPDAGPWSLAEGERKAIILVQRRHPGARLLMDELLRVRRPRLPVDV